ncbi:PREDICTED: uncharacterized protein LOC109219979 [Nicotiana attenuata]|uniref:uncharacterized protein LOC109219979 n=1 Tax=Nicotiana attenuata TaxID=49451 RepID=UPI000904B2B6|nr:PREDICTED: uncharacterized protein LOC109219979 [Nicotiana attenuata]
MQHTDKIGKALKDIDITCINDAVAPLEVQAQARVDVEPSDSQIPVSPQATAASTSTSQPTSQSTIAQPSAAQPAISRLVLLVQHAKAKVDQLLKNLPTLIKKALTLIQSSVTAFQQQQAAYGDRLQHLEMRTLEFDLLSFLPKECEEGADTTAPDLDLDFSTLMSDIAPPTVGASQPPAPPAYIEISSKEDFGHSTESEGEEADEGEDDEDSWSEEDEGHQEKGKRIAVPKVEDEEQAAIQVAIEHSLADTAAPADPSATQPSEGEASSSQAPAPVLGQPEIPPPLVEVTPQAEILSVPTSASEGDPTITKSAFDSHSA